MIPESNFFLCPQQGLDSFVDLLVSNLYAVHLIYPRLCNHDGTSRQARRRSP